MGFTDSDPYVVLGLPVTATLASARVRYYELAKLHHPDKLQNITDEERVAHEEIFKRITCAYTSIENTLQRDSPQYGGRSSTRYGDGCDSGDGDGDGHDAELDIDDWRSVWNHIEKLCKTPGVWDTMKDIVKDTIKDVAVKGLERLSKTHHVTLTVTMEEVHSKKVKKIRVFLNNVAQPVYVTVDLSEYPYVELKHQHKDVYLHICITMQMTEHDVYRFDDVLDSWDLFARVQTTWVDYLLGKNIQLPYLDGTHIDVRIEPFTQYTAPILVSDKGLCGLGDMYISIDMIAPHTASTSRSSWDGMREADRNAVVSCLQKLY